MTDLQHIPLWELEMRETELDKKHGIRRARKRVLEYVSKQVI